MSPELWGPVDKLNARWTMCGHTYRLAHEGFDNCPSKCDVCGREARNSFQKTVVRDFVPSAELSWGGAERNVRRHKHPKVCIYRLCVLISKCVFCDDRRRCARFKKGWTAY